MDDVPEMVERVARRLARCEGGKITGPSRHKASDEFAWDPSHNYIKQYVDKHWREHVNAAFMAMEALKEPTEAMEAAGEKALYDEDERAYHLSRSAYDAYIDAALTSHTDTPKET